jgi:hypothetical protein
MTESAVEDKVIYRAAGGTKTSRSGDGSTRAPTKEPSLRPFDQGLLLPQATQNVDWVNASIFLPNHGKWVCYSMSDGFGSIAMKPPPIKTKRRGRDVRSRNWSEVIAFSMPLNFFSPLTAQPRRSVGWRRRLCLSDGSFRQRSQRLHRTTILPGTRQVHRYLRGSYFFPQPLLLMIDTAD